MYLQKNELLTAIILQLSFLCLTKGAVAQTASIQAEAIRVKQTVEAAHIQPCNIDDTFSSRFLPPFSFG